MANYPSSIYNGRTKENKSGVEFDPTKKNVLFAEDLLLLDAEVTAIETVLGIDPTGEFETIGAYLSALASAISDIPDSFLELADTPASYSGQAGKVVKVNAAGNALEFGEAGGAPNSLVYPYGFQENLIFTSPKRWIIDDDAIYGLTDVFGRRLVKLNRENLSVLAYSNNSDFESQEFCSDADYLYIFYQGSQIKKVDKTDIDGYVSTIYTSGGHAVPVLHGDFIYTIDFYNDCVAKINKNTGAVVGTISISPNWMKPILRQDADYLYVNDIDATKIHRIAKSTFTASGTLTADSGDILDFDVGDDYLVTCEDADNAIILYSLSSFGTYKAWFMFPKACNRINCEGDYALILSSDDTKVYLFQISTCSIVQTMDLKGADIIAFAYSFPYLMTTFVDSSTSFTQVIKNNFIKINVS